MSDLKPQDLLCSHAMRISAAEFAAYPERFTYAGEKQMREAIAHFIQGERVETVVGEFFVEKRIELYVASPAQFWELIHREAMSIAQRYMREPPRTAP